MKVENLETHIERVHPKKNVASPLTAEEKAEVRAARASPRPMRSTAWRAAVVLIAILILAGVVWVLYRPPSPVNASENARIRVEPLSWDFGDIPRSAVSHTFTVTSVGTEPLTLTAISTSCSCTSAILYANGRTSPTFGMMGNPTGWSETLSPGQTANLVVQYDPNVHPDTGPIVRDIYVRSNAASSPEVALEITANVVP